jgi:hypothetical protein
MTSLTSLIERIEAATEGSRELDGDIWLASTPGATRDKWSYIHKATGRECTVDETRDETGRLIIVPSYSTSIDAALTLLPEGFKWKCGYSRHVPHNAEVVDYDSHRGTFIGESDASRCLALLSAILRARQAMQMEAAS